MYTCDVLTDSSDIVDHKLKLILGLIWTLILHYSIALPVWDDDDDDDDDDASAGPARQTPKQRLLAWIQNKIPDRPITNFTSDWSDGRAIGALVDGVAPGIDSSHFSVADWSSVISVITAQLCDVTPRENAATCHFHSSASEIVSWCPTLISYKYMGKLWKWRVTISKRVQV